MQQSKIQLASALTLGLCVGQSLAEPQVIRFAPTDAITLSDVEPAAPSIVLGSFITDPGGGSNGGALQPTLFLSDFPGFGETAESTAGPRATIVDNYGDMRANSYDELFFGDVLDASAPVYWGVSSFDTWYGAPPDNYSLDSVAWISFGSGCVPRNHIAYVNGDTSTSIDNSVPSGIYYIGFRWDDDLGDTRYGWVAFEFERQDYTGPEPCDDFEYSLVSTSSFNYIAAGWETEPEASIVVGGGLCPADLNFDANVDFFDVSTFLDAYTDADSMADLNDDGMIDFFDVSTFLSLYNTSCVQ